MTRTYFKQHGRIEFPAWLKALGFEDRSWGNDACARAERDVVQEGSAGSSDGVTLTVWVNYDLESDREVGSKFGVLLVGRRDGGDTWTTTVYDGEDAAAAEAKCRLAVALFAEAK